MAQKQDFVLIKATEQPHWDEDEKVVVDIRSGLMRKEDWESVKRFMSIPLNANDRHDALLIDNMVKEQPDFRLDEKTMLNSKGVRMWRKLQKDTDDFYTTMASFRLLVEIEPNGQEHHITGAALLGVEGWELVEHVKI